MQTALAKVILAIITLDRESVKSGGAPIFYAENVEQQEKIATTLSRITEGVIHELDNGVKILVKH